MSFFELSECSWAPWDGKGGRDLPFSLPFKQLFSWNYYLPLLRQIYIQYVRISNSFLYHTTYNEKQIRIYDKIKEKGRFLASYRNELGAYTTLCNFSLFIAH